MKKFNSTSREMQDNFFACRGWRRKKCPHCFGEYYTKRDLPHCGSYLCAGSYSFLSFPSPKAQLDMAACVRRLQTSFIGHGYQLHRPIAVVRNNERTLFASTAGQIYDDLIYGQISESSSKWHLVVQPVIRLQEIDLISSIDGISSSFIHSATECWNTTQGNHLETFDRWLDFFSALGLHAGGFCLKIERDTNNWAGRTITSEMLRVHYGGLEVGVANFFFDISQPNGSLATLSDVGVGLERLIWAVNKSPMYLDSIGPPPCVRMHTRVVLHAIRTATLMAGSGVVPGHRNHGSKLRAMIRLVTEEAHHLNLYELVSHYYRQWSTFADYLSVPQEQVYLIIWGEINRELSLGADRNQ